MRRRNRTRKQNQGVGIPEFAICLIALLLSFIPVSNIVMFTACCFTIQTATNEVANTVSKAESRQEATETAGIMENRLKDPVWTAMHTVRSLSTSAKVSVQVIEGSFVQSLSLDQPLPEKLKPQFENNQERFRYQYSLDVPCQIHPFFNIEGFPGPGQIPVIGAPVKYRFHAETTVEHLEALNQ